MSTMTRPEWPHTTYELLRLINRELEQRLNSDPQPATGRWTAEFVNGQYALSKPGAIRVIWSLIGGRIERGAQYHGPDQPAKCVALRNCRLQAEIRVVDERSTGLTETDLMLADEVLRAIILVWDHQRPADFDGEEQEEIWDGFTQEPGQRQIICRYRVTPQLLVHDDPWLYKTADTITMQGQLTS